MPFKYKNNISHLILSQLAGASYRYRYYRYTYHTRFTPL